MTASTRPTVSRPDQVLDAPAEAVLVHDQAIRDPERPGVDIEDVGALLELLPEAEVDLLEDVGGLLLGCAEAAGESPQRAAAALVVLGDAALEGGRRRLSGRGRGDGTLRDVHALPTQRDRKTQRPRFPARRSALRRMVAWSASPPTEFRVRGLSSG